MAYRGREYSEETAANLLRSVRQQEAQFEILSRELQEERRNISVQLEKNKYNSETASVSSLGSSTDESFVWRGEGPGSIADEDELTDDESRMSGSALVDSCLKVLQERGLDNSRDEQDPLYSRKMDSSSTVSGHSNSLVSQDWERQLMETGLTPGSGQSVKKVVTHTEMRTVKTIDGRVVQDSYKPGSTHTTIERYKYGVNGDGQNTPVSGDDYRSGRRGPGSQSSMEDYRSPGSRSGYSSADDGRRTPTANGPPGYMSDGYHTPTGSRSGSQSGYGRASQSLPRQPGRPTTPRGSSSASLPRMSSTARGPSTTYNLSIRVGDVKGSGTDGNVYIQLFGERGNTAKIQLRQAGDTKNKFEKGRTYKFTVDTVDIGKVDRIKLSHDHTGYGSGFYVEEVEVEVPAREDRVKFPCRCWLAQDVDDGKIEREMFAVSQLPNKSYTMSVKLGDVVSPDTNLYIQLFGEKGETSKIMLRPVGSQLNKFEKGRTYKFTVETVDIGRCERLRIGHDSRGPGKGIYVEEVEVTPSEGAHTIFPCSCWLAEDKEDGKLERDVLPGQPKPPRPNTSYHLAVKTGDIPLAGTDANVYFQLIGDEGETEKIQLRQGGKAEKRFERGRTDKFIVETVDVGKVQKLRVGHDNEGQGPGWFLDEVAVDVPAHGDHLVFPCRRWLADNEDDKKTERDLYPGVPVFPPASPSTSPMKTRTIIEKTTTTYETRMSPYSTPTKNPTQEPRYASAPLQKKSLPEGAPFSSKTPIENDPIRHTAAPSLQHSAPDYNTPTKKPLPDGDDYYFNTPYQPTPPGRLTDERAFSQDGPPTIPPAPISVAEADLHFEEPYPRKDRSAAEGPLDMDSRKIVAYQLCLKMGEVLGDGTEGNVFIQLFGDKGMTEKIQLRQTGNSKIRFEKGRTYKFTVETVDIGKIEKVLVSHDSAQEGAGWYLEEVTVDVPSRGEHTVFPSRCWLADGQGDGATVRELVSRPCLYHLALKTGDDKNAGTDANVWVQVLGEKGDTGRVELKRAGAAENLFERGQTDYFTLDAADVGKVEKIRVGHDGKGAASAWYLEEVVLNSAERGEHLVFPCHAWIAEDEGDGSLAKDLYVKGDVFNYSVTIKTGSVKNAGTDSNIYMQIFGDQGDTGVIELKQICETQNKFKRGMTTKFPLQSADVGNLEMVRIGHDGRGLGTGWFLEEVMIIVHDQCWVFPCMRWLADYEDDGKVERELRAGKKTYAHEPDLQDLIEYLQTDDVTLITNSASYLQHLCFNDDGVKAKIRELGGIPVLVRLLDHEAEEVHRSVASCLRNLSFSRERDENKLAIAECGGIEALMRLLKRTPRDAVKEVVLGVLWNLSSCDDLKTRMLELCLIILVITIIIPYSGWNKEAARSGRPIPEIKWSTVFRNASGILRNISSAGPEARKEMRECEGLVDSFTWIIRAPIGKNDVDNKSVENSVCILRNLSYRLEMEVDRERYEDAPLPSQSTDKDTGYTQQGCVAGCGSGARRKGTSKPKDESLDRKEPVEGVELLWHPEIIRPLLSIMAEASNPETLEGAAGAIHNLTACRWRWAVILRSTVRKEKGLPILVELLRISSDPVVRAVATALRNLAIDPRNRDVIGKYAMRDLVHCLPDAEVPTNSVEENTVGALLCAVHQLVNKNIGNGKQLRNNGGFKKIVPIAKSRQYAPKIVKTANQVLITLWNLAALRPALKKESWEYTKEISDQYGQAPTPRPYEDITMPRGGQPMQASPRVGTMPTRSEETTIPDPSRYTEALAPRRPPPPQGFSEDGYGADERRGPRGSQEELEMRGIGHYAELEGIGPEPAAPAHEPSWQASAQPEPMYAVVDKSKKSLRLQADGEGVGDSWV